MGTWTRLSDRHLADSLLLLTDGTLLGSSVYEYGWFRVHPDTSGGYRGARWLPVPTPPGLGGFHRRAGVVLRSGRALFTSRTGLVLFDRGAGWTTEPAPAFEEGGVRLWLDAPLGVLADGRVCIAATLPGESAVRATLLFDPAAPPETAWTRTGDIQPACPTTYTWSRSHAVLLPGGELLLLACRPEGAGIAAQLFDPAKGTWRYAATSAVDPGVGHAVPGRDGGFATLLLPDGRVMVLAHRTVLFYRPPSAGDPDGGWEVGPALPPEDEAGFKLLRAALAACVLPSGRVLCGGHYFMGDTPGLPSETTGRYSLVFYAFDPETGGFEREHREEARPSLGATTELDPYGGVHLQLLPSGEVLVTVRGQRTEHSGWWLHDPDARPGTVVVGDERWRPRIVGSPARVVSGERYELVGEQFTGLTQAVSNTPYLVYGTSQNATGYPLVQLATPGDASVPPQLHYCPTSSHSTMAVATGGSRVSTWFQVPPVGSHGWGRLRVIANGIPSAWVDVEIGGVRPPFETEVHLWTQVIGNLADGGHLVITPFGVRPVPPWDPTFHKVLAIEEDIVRAFRQLEEIGRSYAGSGGIDAPPLLSKIDPVKL